MSEYSSSESEDDSRFREACDPTLSTVFDGKMKERGNEEPLQDHHHDHHDDHHDDDRESFVLLNKIKRSLTSLQAGKGHPLVGLKLHKDTAQCRRKDRKLSGMPAPSTLSSYLAKQLTGLLDKNVIIKRIEGSDIPNKESKDIFGSRGSIRLLKNIIVERTALQDDVPLKRKIIKYKKLCYFDSSDEDEMISRCSSLAVPPQWILDKQDVYPWPHPKNVRYLEKYKVKEKRANGIILATPFKESSETAVMASLGDSSQKIDGMLNCAVIKKETKTDYRHVREPSEAKSYIHCIMKESEKSKIKKYRKVMHDSKSDTSEIKEDIPLKIEKQYCEGSGGSVKKIRSQSRKRGIKKKNKKRQ